MSFSTEFNICFHAIFSVRKNGVVDELPLEVQQKLDGKIFPGEPDYKGGLQKAVAKINSPLVFIAPLDFLEAAAEKFEPVKRERAANAKKVIPVAQDWIDCFVIAIRPKIQLNRGGRNEALG